MNNLLPILSIVAVFVFIAGCTSGNIPVIENTVSALEPPEMALHLSDLPAGYVQGDSLSITAEQASQYHVNKGYQVQFINGSSPSDRTVITQAIFVVPIDEINKRFENASSTTLGTHLADPGIGESSIALRKEGSGQPGETFIISFMKKDVLETLMMSGSQADYEVLKTLAKRASEKIQ